MTHRVVLTKETHQDGHLSGYAHARCSCGKFHMRGRSVDVAIGMLEHQGGWISRPGSAL